MLKRHLFSRPLPDVLVGIASNLAGVAQPIIWWKVSVSFYDEGGGATFLDHPKAVLILFNARHIRILFVSGLATMTTTTTSVWPYRNSQSHRWISK